MKNNYSFNNEHFMHIIIIVLLLVIIVMLYMYHSKGNTYESFYDDSIKKENIEKKKIENINIDEKKF